MISRLKRRSLFKHLFLGTLSLSLTATLTNCAAQPQAGSPTTDTSQASPVASPASAATTVLRVGFISSDGGKIPVGLEGWAQEQGYLASELKSLGISEVKFFPFSGGPALNESLASGALDMGLYGDTPALVGRAAGLKTKLINQSRVGQDSWLLTVQDGPKSLEALKGKKVGVAKGTYMHRYLLGLIDQSGLAKAVKVVQIPTVDAKAALERGEIAAYPFPTGSGPLLASKGFPILDQATNHTGLVGTSVSIATEDLLAKYPELPRQWNQIRQRALQAAKANPEAFYQFASKTSKKLPLLVIKESYAIDLYPNQPFTDEGIRLLNSTKQFLADQKLLKSNFEIQDWQAANP
ncbi:ABC transporter substrate-binding protein [Leptolyngbya sp. FACHB-36]|uniref:ABC transporter substrate-binding protein n=1 Tax=Leptolyngbya sp. FACHB-36 TaxID=2692808 RepID=UPI0016803AFB|nr:ABC transporter substrate-binding protein [Leptolyngbya sp. FACHB-36]MBD2021025.1 ABC transporter substrate-binding protein [Leptolyngbya sp. FACHB-36]